jgi:hypothetical protein
MEVAFHDRTPKLIGGSLQAPGRRTGRYILRKTRQPPVDGRPWAEPSSS